MKLSTPILHPRITEKATMLSDAPKGALTYTFEVHSHATKATIAKAIKAMYKVIPAAVHIVRLPAKRVTSQGKIGRKAAVKKALVTLKKGEKIEAL